MKSAVKMDAGFLVNGDPVGAGFGEGRDELIGIFDHEVAIECDAGKGFAERGNDGWTDGDVGDEVAVHDVEMENGAATIKRSAGVSGEIGEVGGEDGGDEFDRRRQLRVPRFQVSKEIIYGCDERLTRNWEPVWCGVRTRR